jgi:uncharacterized protein (DUF849 family)
MPRKVILTCAVTGENDYNRAHPNFPITPQQIADAAEEAAKAGASVVHVHVRDPLTGVGSRDPALFREMVGRIRDKNIDIVINVTCGGGAFFMPDPEDESRAGPGSDIASVAERVRHIEDTLPEMCSLDVCTANQVDGAKDYVYLNTPRTLKGMARRFQELGVKPEMEVFNPGDLLLARQIVDEGFIDGVPLFQMVLGVRWGAPADAETILYMKRLLPETCHWAAFGIARLQMPMVAQSVLLGGNVRVGLEDNLYLSRGVFASNGQLVERARQIVENLGEEVATPAETRALLGLRGAA